MNIEEKINSFTEDILKKYGKCLRNIVIGNDCDSVLLKCDEAVAEIEGFSYRVYKDWGKTYNKEYDKKFFYYKMKDFVINQPLMPGAKEYIDALKRMGATIRYVTAVDEECLTERVLSLREKFGATINEVVLTQDKSFVMDYHLDDRDANVLNSTAKHPILMRRPWNDNMTGFPSVNNLYEALFFIVYNELLKNMPVNKDNCIIVLTGPGGSGKHTLCQDSGLNIPVTYSTRKKPEKYKVLSKKEFVKQIDNGEFIETSVYAGNYYGIKEGAFDEDKQYICTADIGGAVSLKSAYPDRVRIVYVKKPTLEIYGNIYDKKLPRKETILMTANVETEKLNRQYAEEEITGLRDLRQIIKNI